MGSSKNKIIDVIHENQPKQIVIVTGPTFGTAVKFLAAGAVLGAAGVLYLNKRRQSTPATGSAAVREELGLGEESDQNVLVERANALLRRVKTLSARARDTIQSASEALAPTIQEAIEEAKAAASQTQEELKKQFTDEPEKKE